MKKIFLTIDAAKNVDDVFKPLVAYKMMQENIEALDAGIEVLGCKRFHFQQSAPIKENIGK